MSRSIGICCALSAFAALCGIARADDRAPYGAGNAARSAPSHAPDTDEDTIEKITARKLFLEGRALLDQARTREACAILERSQALNPTLAALLNLGLCYKALGRVVTAHDYYRKAEVQATLRGDTVRREFAHDEAAAMAPLRATLTLRVAGAKDADLEVLVDDKPQAREIWNQPIFIDSGEHRIVVRAADDQTWEGSVIVVDGGKHLIVVPEIARKVWTAEGPASAPEAPAAAASTPLAKPFIPVRGVQSEREASLSTQQIVALGTGVAGVGALTLSVIYAIHAKGTWNDSNSRGCTRATNQCSAEGLQLRDDARADATRSTVFAIAGGAALVGGLVLWLARPNRSEESASLSLSTSTDAITAAWSGVL